MYWFNGQADTWYGLRPVSKIDSILPKRQPSLWDKRPKTSTFKAWQSMANTIKYMYREMYYLIITCITHENHLWNRILRFALGLGSKLKHTDLHLLDFFPVFPVAKLQLYRRIKRSESSVSSHKVWKGYERFIFGSYSHLFWSFDPSPSLHQGCIAHASGLGP